MKKIFLPMAVCALLAAACSSNNENQQSVTYADYNLIIDNDNPDAPAQASASTYGFTAYYSKGGAAIQGNDIIINNQKYSFETDTMAYSAYYFKTELNGSETTIGQTTFSKPGSTGLGSSASDLKGAILGMYYPATNDSLSTTFNVGLMERLDLSYTLANRYKVQTFWPNSFYIGQTYASDSQESLSSRTPRYMVNVNFSSSKATVFVYNSELSTSDSSLPKVIRIGDIPVHFNHNSYYLEAESPKTTVLSKRNGTPMLIDSVGFQVENFSLRITSEDLTEADINYRLKGKSVNFTGSSVPKPVK